MEQLLIVCVRVFQIQIKSHLCARRRFIVKANSQISRSSPPHSRLTPPIVNYTNSPKTLVCYTHIARPEKPSTSWLLSGPAIVTELHYLCNFGWYHIFWYRDCGCRRRDNRVFLTLHIAFRRLFIYIAPLRNHNTTKTALACIYRSRPR